MNRELLNQFAQKLVLLNGKDYLKAVVLFSAAPTIQGQKPSSLLNFNHCGKNLMTLWDTHGQQICKTYNLQQFCLVRCPERLTFLLYRKAFLHKVLFKASTRCFLKYHNYPTTSVKLILMHLKKRFSEGCPHEMGIFLGIPLEEIQGFIQNCGQNAIATGYWKVYCNPARAKQLFTLYDFARNHAISQILNASHPSASPA